MDLGYIYETQASYTHSTTAPDRTAAALRPLVDDVHPMWGIACHYPAWLADESDSNGDHWEIIPHVLLEEYCARFGFDPEEPGTIVDAILHNKLPDAGDPLAHLNPRLEKALKAAADIPDHLDVRMPYEERREAVLARVAVAKRHLIRVEAAPKADRQGALDYRRAIVEHAADRLADQGEELPEVYRFGLDDVAPDDPLEPITSSPLDGNRVRTRRARMERDVAAASGAHPAIVAATGPQTFGMNRLLPPT